MIKIELTPYERSILDTAILYYLANTKDANVDAMFKPMVEENRNILRQIQDKMYQNR